MVAINVVLVAVAGNSQEMERGKDGHNHVGKAPLNARLHRKGPPSTFYTDVPAHDFDIILGRPTGDSVTISVLAYAAMEGYVTYGTTAGELARKSGLLRFEAGLPQEVLLKDLVPDTQQYYRLHWRRLGADTFTSDAIRSFHTQRSPGASFTFTVQADSHLDSPEAPDLYARTLHSALNDAPDFHIDLGDTFMTDKYRQDYTQASAQYLAQRYYFGLLCHSAPLFLVLGNHDGESGGRFNGAANSMSAWSNTMRTRYFPNPVPNDFYTGNARPLDPLGLLEDYYAWEWGDALFVVLDPNWFTTTRPRGGNEFWGRTLGQDQYRWLERTLETSGASFKFVFIHNLVGGADSSMRGGAEAAKYFEWGGHDMDGRFTFEEHRPGWSAPIHELLKRHGVDVVFHGHDHFFAHQELDGVTYQLVPQPSRTGGRDAGRMASEYGYVTGDFLPSPGYLRIAIDGPTAKVSYISTRTKQSTVAHEYEIKTGPPKESEGVSP